MSADTTPNAAYISQDGNVSFDASGYRLDGLGNRTYNNAGIWGESKPRYSKPIQDAINAYEAEVARYEAERDAFLQAIQAQPGMWSMPSTASTWRPGATEPRPPGSAIAPRPAWDNIGAWRTPQQLPAQPPYPQSPNLQSPNPTGAQSPNNLFLPFITNR